MKKALNVRDCLVMVFMAVMVLYPLYMKNGFVRLATAKKELYYISCCALLLPALIITIVSFLTRSRKEASAHPVRFIKADYFAFGYLAVLAISTLSSSYQDNAISGSSGWYMGFTTQMFFLLSYFVISRTTGYSKTWMLALFGASAVIYFLCVLARFHVNVFGLYDGRDEDFWNAYIPTIGQKNWYACFLIIVFSIELGYFLVRRNSKADMWLIPLISIGTMATVMQDSDSIYVGFLFVMLFLFEMFCNDLSGLKRFLLMLSIIFLSLQVLGIIQVLFEDSMVSLSSMVTFIPSSIFVRAAGVVCVALWLFLEFIFDRLSLSQLQRADRAIHLIKRVLLVLAAVTILALIVLIILVSNFSDSLDFGALESNKYFVFCDSWGTYRGINWMTAIESFLEVNLWQKLFGIGPDCYYSYVSVYHKDFTAIWSSAICNTHNEFLNALIDTGLLGAVCYYGIFISILTDIYRQKKQKPILLALGAGITGFIFNNLFSFMNIISTPLLFVIAGIASHIIRENPVLAGKSGR